METNHLIVEKKDNIATLYLNRPEKKNAITREMWRAIPNILQELAQDDEVKVLIIRGINDQAFAAGADIREFKERLTEPEAIRAGEEDAVQKAEEAIMNFPKPTIAMIQKFCIGGGCVIALSCDLRFSSDTGIFAITPAKIGLIYSFSKTKNLVRAVGPSRAKDILFSARQLSAEEAYRIGLVDYLYPDAEIVEKTYAYAKLLTTRAQRTIRGAKAIIAAIMDGMEEESEEIKRMTAEARQSADYKEGVNAFLEKRAPVFKEVSW